MRGDVRAVRLTIRGLVQGVGFRDFVLEQAERYRIAGYVVNMSDGSVVAVAEGQEQALEEFIAALKQGPPQAQIKSVDAARLSANGNFSGFSIRY